MKKKEIFYKIADVVRAVKGEPPVRFTSAIIVAAGNSTRMGGGVSKQMALLDGMPVVVRISAKSGDRRDHCGGARG